MRMSSMEGALLWWGLSFRRSLQTSLGRGHREIVTGSFLCASERKWTKDPEIVDPPSGGERERLLQRRVREVQEAGAVSSV